MPSIEEITAAVVAALNAEQPTEQPASKPATRKPATRKASSKRSKVAATCITAGQAWQLLGADEQYKPRDPDKPATNAQLWNLNAQGRLTVS
jgi:hypothetical protein